MPRRGVRTAPHLPALLCVGLPAPLAEPGALPGPTLGPVHSQLWDPRV